MVPAYRRGGAIVSGPAVPSAWLEPDELDRDLDHQPVVAAQVEPGELHDPSQPLPQRVRVNVQSLRRSTDVAAPAQELLERAEERGPALCVVRGEPRDGVAVAVSDVAVERHAEEVLVRPELVVRQHALVLCR